MLLSAGLLAAILVAQPNPTATSSAHAPPQAVQNGFLLSQSFAAEHAKLTTVEERVRLIDRAMISAETCRRNREERCGDLFSWCASKYSDAGMRDRAQAALESYLRAPDSDLGAADAYRLLGNMHMVSRLSAPQAIAAFEKQLALYDQNPKWLPGMVTSYSSGVNLLANLQQNAGDLKGALATNARVLGEHRKYFDEFAITAALQQVSQLHAKLGDNAKALEATDELLRLYPNYGVKNGFIISLQLKRIELRHPKHGQAEVEELRQLWSDERLSAFSDILHVGDKLYQAQARAGQIDASLDTVLACIQLIDKHEPEWITGAVEHRAKSMRLQRFSLLQLLGNSSAKAGRPELALYAVDRLLKTAQDPTSRTSLLRQKQELEVQMKSASK